MKKLVILSVVMMSLSIAAIAYSCRTAAVQGPAFEPELSSVSKPAKTMKPFASEDDLKSFFTRLAEQRERDAKQRAEMKPASANTVAKSSAAMEPAALADGVSFAKDDAITNTQHAGVDEGGIIKVHGEHLVILRRGRLFTVRVGDYSLKPVTSIDAYAPGINPSNDWYDEMLVSGDTVVVIGYSYARGGTEINLFDIDAAGKIDYRSTYHLRSNDYYSSRNYASRLIGSKLIFYTPQYIGISSDAMRQFPAIRRWHKGAKPDEFKSIVEPTRVYRPEKPLDSSNGLALHTVTVCDLANGFSCQGTAILGAPGRVFYVSPTSVYVWTTEWNYGSRRPKSSSMLYKMPLDASAPSGLGVTGSPVDQFSFYESDDNNLNVLVRSDGQGEQMWGSEFSNGDVALFRTPLDSFSDGSQQAPDFRYRELPKPEGYTFQNRFVGDHLLYGTGSGWGTPTNRTTANLFVVDYANGDLNEIVLKHGVDRIEQMGSDAVVIGTNGSDLYFSPVRLSGDVGVAESFVRKNASQGELRSHGFFYKPSGRDSGLLGLPIAREGRPGYRHLVEDSAAVIFLKNEGLDFSEMGELEARNAEVNDGCRASCVDWYGNARPIFLRNRVFALLGYEIVEGSVAGNQIRETRRVNYSPGRRFERSEE